MSRYESIELTRDVEATVVPVGDRVTLLKGEEATITQSLGGTYTIMVNGNMFRVDSRNGDALGKEVELSPAEQAGKADSKEDLSKQIWDQMRTVYDPEIPVNVVDLGLIYRSELKEIEDGGGYTVEVDMTLTAPGCGMGDVLCQDIQSKVLCVDGVEQVDVQLVWEPQWNQDMMSEAAKLQLGFM